MVSKKQETGEKITIEALQTGILQVGLLGKTPLVYNRMSEKVKQGLLNPKAPGIARGTKAEQAAAGPKHNMLEEFRLSAHCLVSSQEPSLLAFPASGVKKAMMTAALEMPGSNKTQIGRLVWVPGEYLPVFGVPQLRVDVVRMANKEHTPDVRTRACIRQWATIVEVQFVEPLLAHQAITNLLSAAGLIVGLGDYRQEKGAGDFGTFDVVDLADPRLKAIVKAGGREAQIAALADPAFYDDESRSLFEWWAQNAPAQSALQGASISVRERGNSKKAVLV